MVVWVLYAWLCASGDGRPVEVVYQTRGECLKAERVLRHENPGLVQMPRCHHRDPMVG